MQHDIMTVLELKRLLARLDPATEMRCGPEIATRLRGEICTMAWEDHLRVSFFEVDGRRKLAVDFVTPPLDS
jgi:hypothetical protein